MHFPGGLALTLTRWCSATAFNSASMSRCIFSEVVMLPSSTLGGFFAGAGAGEAATGVVGF